MTERQASDVEGRRGNPYGFPLLLAAVIGLQATALWGVYRHAYSEGARRSTIEALDDRIGMMQSQQEDSENRAAATRTRVDQEAEELRHALEQARAEVIAERRRGEEARLETQPALDNLEQLRDAIAAAGEELDSLRQSAKSEAQVAETSIAAAERAKALEQEALSSLAKITGEVNATEQQREEARVELEALRTRAADAERIRGERQEELGRLLGEKDVLTQTIGTLNLEIERIESEQATLRASIGSDRDEKARLDAELVATRQRLEAVRSESASETERLAEVRLELARAEASVNRMTREEEIRSTTRMNELELLVTELTNRKSSLEGEVASLQQATARLRSELASLTTTGELSEQLSSALSSARAALSEELSRTTEELEKLVDLQAQLRLLREEEGSDAPSSTNDVEPVDVQDATPEATQ